MGSSDALRVLRGAVRSVAAAIFLGLAALLRRIGERAQAKSDSIADVPGLDGTYLRGFIGTIAEISLAIAIVSAAFAACLGIWALVGLFWPTTGSQRAAAEPQ